jgi:hypothetical protein
MTHRTANALALVLSVLPVAVLLATPAEVSPNASAPVSAPNGRPSPPPASQVVWIAVIGGGMLGPVAAKVGGTWWFDEDPIAHSEEMERRYDAMKAAPRAEWLPPGVPLPLRWSASLLTARSLSITISGRYADIAGNDLPLARNILRVQTAVPWSKDQTRAAGPEGVAFHGAVRAGVFKDLPDAEQNVVRPWIADGAVEADLAALRDAPAAYRALTRSALKALPFEIERVVWSDGWDGARYYVAQGDRVLPAPPNERCTIHTRIAIRRTRSGAQRLLRSWGEYSCEGMQIFETPLAWLERDGQVCWVMELAYEDGIGYSVTTPDRLTASSPSCTIR